MTGTNSITPQHAARKPERKPEPAAQGLHFARHRRAKPNRGKWRTAVTRVAGTLALVAATGGGIASAAARPATVPLPIVPPAGVLAAYAQTAPASWHARTCQAFYTWDAHRTSAHLDTLMTDSEHVPWRWLGGDVLNVYRDIRSSKTKYLVDDVHNMVDDCHPGSGL